MSINPASSRSHRSAWDVLWTVGLLVLITAGLCSRSFAQTDTGRIVGTVTDPTGAAISGATVTVTNQANGLKFSAIANAAGQFNIFAVPRGTYLAKIDAQGFASQAQTFDLAVTQVQTLLFKLQPGAVNVTVKVTDAAPLIDASNATLGETIQGKQITQLPLNGRNFTNLALLAPGVTRGAYGTEESGVNGNSETFRYNESGGAALSVNGLRPQANNYILDGVDNNDGLINTILFFPPIDATQEFKIDTSVAPAQFGRAGGAIVVSSIRSGTNSIHGSAFEFYRSGKWDSNPDYRFQGQRLHRILPTIATSSAVQLACRSSKTSCSPLEITRDGVKACPSTPALLRCPRRRCAPAISVSCSIPPTTRRPIPISASLLALRRRTFSIPFPAFLLPITAIPT